MDVDGIMADVATPIDDDVGTDPTITDVVATIDHITGTGGGKSFPLYYSVR